jgi:hypothetical protein
LRLAAEHQVRQRNVLQAAAGEVLGLGHVRVCATLAVGLVTRPQGVEQLLGDLLAGKLAGGVDGIDIGHLADFGEVGLARQREHFGDHGRVQRLVASTVPSAVIRR